LGTPERTHRLLLLLWPLIALVIVVLVVRRASTAKDLADLISAFASLMWPVVTIAIVNWFRPEIRAILSRIKKGKFLGQEIELAELEARTVAAEEKAEDWGASSGASEPHLEASGTVGPDIAQDAIEEVLREASRSPRLGLMLLSAKIERAARELGADTAPAFLAGPRTLTIIVRQLVAEERLPEEAAEAFYLFTRVRNRIVHGDDADDEEVARAIDSGTRLLRLLLSRRRPQPETKRPEPGMSEERSAL
jgi:hypothetical protein